MVSAVIRAALIENCFMGGCKAVDREGPYGHMRLKQARGPCSHSAALEPTMAALDCGESPVEAAPYAPTGLDGLSFVRQANLADARPTALLT
jgi:hypothetical protein